MPAAGRAAWIGGALVGCAFLCSLLSGQPPRTVGNFLASPSAVIGRRLHDEAACPAGAAPDGPVQRIDGGHWCLVSQRNATDSGLYPDHALEPFRDLDFADFLFATGDLTKWMVMSKAQVYQRTGRGGMQKAVQKSWQHAEPHQALMFYRHGHPEDPWIADDRQWAPQKHEILYGENEYAGKEENYNRVEHGGLAVYIRTVQVPAPPVSPSPPVTSSSLPPMPHVDDDACLCLFDIDRTLTAKQGSSTSQCPGSEVIHGVYDNAYGHGWLTLSQLGAAGLSSTFCGACYLGVVSHGNAGGHGSRERAYLATHVLVTDTYNNFSASHPDASKWSGSSRVHSNLVLGWPDREKQDAVRGIVEWYATQGVVVPPSRVHFFGDRVENIPPFAGTGFNAREISCGSRDYSIHHGMVGLCGARVEEIVDTPGVATCSSQGGHELDSSPGRDGTNLGICQGDCDRDEDCSGNLRCFQRRSLEPVPGCTGTGINAVDYCYAPPTVPPQPPSPPPPVPSPSPTPTPSVISGEPSPSPPPVPSPSPTPTPSVTSGEPSPSPLPVPSPSPAPTPSATSGEPFPSPSPAVPSPNPAPSSPVTSGEPCLCLFDIDRTLTAKQGSSSSQCPGSQIRHGTYDNAYGGGWLTLSEVGAAGLSTTFCGACYLGVVSHGNAGGAGSREREYLTAHTLVTQTYSNFSASHPDACTWSGSSTVQSNLVLGWPDREKQDAVRGIVEWYATQGVVVPSSRVHFFGDRTENIGPFAGTGFNAREISCGSRDYSIHHGMVGLCGARLEEIVDTPGVATCSSQGGHELDSSPGRDGTNLGMCQGDCDNDEDCSGNLRCFQRTGTEPVPGCTGTGIQSVDYCTNVTSGSSPSPSPSRRRSRPRCDYCLPFVGICFPPGCRRR